MINKTINRLPKSIVDVDIKASWSDIENYWNNTLQKLTENVEIPGFRKGSAPLNMVEQQLGPARIQEEFLKDAMPQILVAVLQEEQIIPIDYPKYQLVAFAKGQDLSFKATVTQRPVVQVGDYKQIKVQKPSIRQITGEDVNKVIADLFKRWKARESSLKAGQGGTPVSSAQGTGDNSGASKADNSINFSSPGNGGLVDSAGQPLTHPHNTPAQLPDQPDDNFAIAVGALGLTDLTNKIKADLENEAKYNNELDFEEAILQEIEKITQVEIPDVLVEDELNRMMVSLQGRVSEMGLLLEDYLKTQNETVEGIRAKWREQATKNVRMELGLAEVARLENINITDAQLQAEIDKIQDARLKARFEAEEPRLHLRHSLRQLATLDKLKAVLQAQPAPAAS